MNTVVNLVHHFITKNEGEVDLIERGGLIRSRLHIANSRRFCTFKTEGNQALVPANIVVGILPTEHQTDLFNSVYDNTEDETILRRISCVEDYLVWQYEILLKPDDFERSLEYLDFWLLFADSEVRNLDLILGMTVDKRSKGEMERCIALAGPIAGHA